jgi:hypothetical protein
VFANRRHRLRWGAPVNQFIRGHKAESKAVSDHQGQTSYSIVDLYSVCLSNLKTPLSPLDIPINITCCAITFSLTNQNLSKSNDLSIPHNVVTITLRCQLEQHNDRTRC